LTVIGLLVIRNHKSISRHNGSLSILTVAVTAVKAQHADILIYNLAFFIPNINKFNITVALLLSPIYCSTITHPHTA
jgi:hypothetical protein